MRDGEVWIIFPLFFVTVLIWTGIWYASGIYNGATEAVDKTTVECIEKPNICKDRYQYMKLGEKLEKTK
jgi:ABC-type polysaccharide transport system permease subunit